MSSEITVWCPASRALIHWIKRRNLYPAGHQSTHRSAGQRALQIRRERVDHPLKGHFTGDGAHTNTERLLYALTTSHTVYMMMCVAFICCFSCSLLCISCPSTPTLDSHAGRLSKEGQITPAPAPWTRMQCHRKTWHILPKPCRRHAHYFQLKKPQASSAAFIVTFTLTHNRIAACSRLQSGVCRTSFLQKFWENVPRKLCK